MKRVTLFVGMALRNEWRIGRNYIVGGSNSMKGRTLLVEVALWKGDVVGVSGSMEGWRCWWEWLYGRNDVVGGSSSMGGMTLLVGVALWKE